MDNCKQTATRTNQGFRPASGSASGTGGAEHHVQPLAWRFQIDQEDVGVHEGWFAPAFDRTDWREVMVPGAWDMYETALRGYQGVGWYCAWFDGSDSLLHRTILQFGAVGGRCWIWINGCLAATSQTRYLPFEVDAQPFVHKAGEPSYERPAATQERCRRHGRDAVVVKVDNRPQGAAALPGSETIEWVLYGGLIGEVTCAVVPACRIAGLIIRSVPAGTGAKVDVEADLINDGPDDFGGEIHLQMVEHGGAGRDATAEDRSREPASERASLSVVIGAGQRTRVHIQMHPEQVTLWHPDRPFLYAVAAELRCGGAVACRARERFGVCSWQRRGSKILLNGEPFFFKGVCRYDEVEPYGPCAPEEVIREDLERIKATGANTIRVHYPQHPVHLRIADELGLVYMLEVPLCWWMPEPGQELDSFAPLVEEALDVVQRMWELYANHPCWAIWSLSNECATQMPAGRALMDMLLARVRSLETGRLATWTANRLPYPGEMDAADLVVVNVYFGVHHQGIIAQHEREFGEKVYEPTAQHMAELAAYYPNHPLLAGEFGTVSVKGLRGDYRLTEDHHAAYLRCVAEALTQCEHLAGMVLWAWADYFHNRDFIGRGGHLHTTFGPYGVVTAHRRIKVQPYRALCEIFGGAPRHAARCEDTQTE